MIFDSLGRFQCRICKKSMEELDIIYHKFGDLDLGFTRTFVCKECGITIKEIYQDYSAEQLKEIVDEVSGTYHFESIEPFTKTNEEGKGDDR